MDDLKIQKNLRFITILFCVISAIILFCGIFASFSLDHIFSETLQEQAETQILEYRNNLTREVENNFKTLNTLARFMEHDTDLTPEEFGAGLYDANLEAGFLSMVFLDEEKEGIYVTQQQGAQPFSADYFIKEAPHEIIDAAFHGEAAISAVYYAEFFQETVVSYAVPIWSDRTVSGVLLACKSIDNFQEIVNSGTVLTNQAVTALVNSKGAILTGSERVVSTGLSSVYNWESIDSDSKKQMTSLLEKNEKGSVSCSINGLACTALIMPLGIRDWSVVVIDSENGISDPLYQNMTITRITSILPLFLAIVCIFYGYGKMRESNKKLLRLAYFDALTGAYNMEKFSRMLAGALETRKSYAVIGINIRHFKFINEIFGTEQANRLLLHIKTVLEQNIRPGEFFCRESADAFFIMMEESHREVIKRRLEKIIAEIDTMVLNKHQKYPIIIYCGVSFTADCSKDTSLHGEIMTRVMFAMNRAKLSGQQCIWFYDLELHKNEMLQNYIESHMESALQGGEFKLYLQPKINLQTKTLCGAEALVRWITHEGDMIFPDQFIPLFEENGFCIKLDLYMVRQVCILLRQWMDEGYDAIPISVNQTKLLFYDVEYPNQLREMMETYQILPRLITLEILEGLAMANIDELNISLSRLQNQGFRISMDDFGSGYSSLNTLGNLKIDELKLDRGFLLAASKDGGGRQRLIMEQIIILAKKMMIETVTEGIETFEDEAMVTSLGCDYGQGYYYSRPIPAEEFFETYIKENHPSKMCDGGTLCKP